MPRLKAYENLDLRPHEVDACGRLTSTEERKIIEDFTSSYGVGRARLPYSTIDMALARSRGVRPHQMVIVLRQKELPLTERVKDQDAIVGTMIGHIADREDKTIIKAFKPLRQSYRIMPKINRAMDNRNTIMIDMFLNVSKYSDATMLSFLMRKMQESKYGACMSILCWNSTKVAPSLSRQLAEFGYHPYGIGNYEDMKNPMMVDGKCLAWWALKTFDSKEGGEA